VRPTEALHDRSGRQYAQGVKDVLERRAA